MCKDNSREEQDAGSAILTSENYFSLENNMKYMSASQVISFMNCEAAALAEIKGEYKREKTTSLLVGSFVDAYFSNEIEQFKIDNPEIFTSKGELKAQYKHAEYIIERIQRDELFMRYVLGKRQIIKTGLIDGIPFKIKIDSYHPQKAIVDLKIVKDFQPIYKEGQGRISFVEAWNYDLQGAIYQPVEGNNLPFFIAAATKEKEPDLAVINIPQNYLDVALELAMPTIHRAYQIKQGLIEPERCEKCDYCKRTKVLKSVISLDEFNIE